jgi:putative SOS response-associated peptidase YedK
MILALTEEIYMCGRFTFQPTEAFFGRFQISNHLDSLVPRYNIAPGQMVPVIIITFTLSASHIWRLPACTMCG